MNLPNFIIIGASKAGTTSLYFYLKQHPEIYMSPVKESGYFVMQNEPPPTEDDFALYTYKRKRKVFINNLADYKALFRGVTNEKALGEATPSYLCHPLAAQRIHALIPKVKLIVILRNPYDAAYSQYLMTYRNKVGRYADFLESIRKEHLLEENPWSRPQFQRQRFYDTQIARYLNFFSKEQMRFFLYEDFQRPHVLLKEIFHFLEVDGNFKPDLSTQYNVGSKNIQSTFLNSFMHKIPVSLRNNLQYVLPEPIFDWYMKKRLGGNQGKVMASRCPEAAKTLLRPVFNPRILRLQELIDRDLSNWIEKPQVLESVNAKILQNEH